MTWGSPRTWTSVLQRSVSAMGSWGGGGGGALSVGQHPGRSQRIYKNVQKSIQLSLELDLWKKETQNFTERKIFFFFSPLLNLQFLDAGEFFFWVFFSRLPEKILPHDSTLLQWGRAAPLLCVQQASSHLTHCKWQLMLLSSIYPLYPRGQETTREAICQHNVSGKTTSPDI